MHRLVGLVAAGPNRGKRRKISEDGKKIHYIDRFIDGQMAMLRYHSTYEEKIRQEVDGKR